MLGVERSMIDAYAFPMIRGETGMLPGGIADFPNVQVMHDRLAANPAVQKVLATEDSQ